ncbi:ribonuclease inhibitor-like [Engraulis encrasicolus]|uniref:ribonuclease inhibitor-like n=1 Tax=Engraulis encrasicolus TaxID=184585 RepID=UPI002FCFEB74
MLLPGQQQTRTFRFEMSKDQLDEFDLSKYIQTPEKDQTELLSPDDVLHKLVPVVIKSTSAGLRNCYLTEKSCSYLAAVLTSQFSHLKHLYLGDNDLRDSGVELLCSGLKHPNCKLETLQLDRCKLTEKSCSYLESALISDSCLEYLSLKFNGLKDTDVEQLSKLEADHFYKLERLEWR